LAASTRCCHLAGKAPKDADTESEDEAPGYDFKHKSSDSEKPHTSMGVSQGQNYGEERESKTYEQSHTQSKAGLRDVRWWGRTAHV
jgi:hypothetical protein